MNSKPLKSLLLKGVKDVFNGITVDLSSVSAEGLQTASSASDSVNIDLNNFPDILEQSIKEWKSSQIRGVWLKIPKEKAELIPAAIKNGFELHHCSASYVMLTNWLTADVEVSKLPTYSSHYLGCGGAVVDFEKEEILLITERYLTPRSPEGTKVEKLPWKVPGGALDEGEDVAKCVVREVFEETGVKCEFSGMLGFRHMHNYRFGKGDVYFACILTPLQKDLNPDPREIGYCEWIPLKDYFAMDYLNRVQTEIQACVRIIYDAKKTNPVQATFSWQNYLWQPKDISQYQGKPATWFGINTSKL